jgi:hypothetical protein
VKEDTSSIVPCSGGKLAQLLAAPVRGCVVDEDDLLVYGRPLDLGEDALEGSDLVVDRNDDGKLWTWHRRPL